MKTHMLKLKIIFAPLLLSSMSVFALRATSDKMDYTTTSAGPSYALAPLVATKGRPLRKDVPFVPRQCEFARNVAKLIHFINLSGYEVTLGETIRSKEEAEANYKKGIGIRDSNHLYRLAIDLNLFKDGKYLTKEKYYAFAGAYWKTLNKFNDWFSSDSNHFEMD